MKIEISEVRRVLQKVLIKKGLSRADARLVAEEYLEGELQGKPSHGLMAFPSILKRLPLKTKPPIVRKKSDSFIFVDAQLNLGLLVGYDYAKVAIQMAKKQGVAVVSIANMLSWLRPATLAEYIAKKGMVGVVVNSGGSKALTVPGGFEPLLGTNPIGIGIPTVDGNVVVDMATSKRAWGVVRTALAAGSALPRETYFDDNGRYTTNPKKAISVEAFGEYKGFALALLIEILGGSFVGMPMNVPVNKEARTTPRGAMIMIFDPQFTTSIQQFKNSNTKLTKKIKSSHKRPGVPSILVPGERARAYRERALRRKVVDIPADLWKRILSLET